MFADKLLDSYCSDLDDDIELGDESDIDNDWEYESEDIGSDHGTDRGSVTGDADVFGADVGGGVGDTDCGVGSSSVVRDGSIEDSYVVTVVMNVVVYLVVMMTIKVIMMM